MTVPPIRPIDWRGSHRLIPSRYSESGTLLSAVSETDAMLADLVLLDGATNDRIQGEERGLIGISTYEFVYGIPNAHIVNAAFAHTSEMGCRFNDHTRGAWYAAEHLETSTAEVVYHKARRLADIVVRDLRWQRPDKDVSTYDDWRADFQAKFHVLEPAAEFSECLQPEPVPRCYAASQTLAARLLKEGSSGLVYPSVRRCGFLCLACFRPALVYNPRRASRYEISFRATAAGYEHEFRETAY